jgi:uncharacterized protein YidB (DUF937 family)
MANVGKLALAVLGVLAYQNRDKLAALLRGDANKRNDGGLLDSILGSSGSGLRDIVERFRTAGAGAEADSWVRQGPNKPLQRDQVEKAIDPDTLEQLSLQTGLSRDELLDRLTIELPRAVDEMTPNGQMPDKPASSTGPNLLDDVPPGPGRPS